MEICEFGIPIMIAITRDSDRDRFATKFGDSDSDSDRFTENFSDSDSDSDRFNSIFL